MVDAALAFLLTIFFSFLMAAAIALVLGLPVWLLWNWFVPELFHLPQLSFWQAVGLNLLCGVLFRSNCECECSGKK